MQKKMAGLIKKFSNTYKFCNNDINKFILLLKMVFILMNTWIVREDLTKLCFQLKVIFAVNEI